MCVDDYRRTNQNEPRFWARRRDLQVLIKLQHKTTATKYLHFLTTLRRTEIFVFSSKNGSGILVAGDSRNDDNINFYLPEWSRHDFLLKIATCHAKLLQFGGRTEKEARLAQFILSHRKALFFLTWVNDLTFFAYSLAERSTIDIKMHVAPCVTSINSRAAFSAVREFRNLTFQDHVGARFARCDFFSVEKGSRVGFLEAVDESGNLRNSNVP